MRFSDLAGKELIDVREGLRLGELGDAELVFEVRTGRVRAIVVAPRGPWWRRSRELIIPWPGVRKIGVDVIVVDLGMGGEGALPTSEGGSQGYRRDADGGIGGPAGDFTAQGWGGNGNPPQDQGAFWTGTPGGSAFFFRRR